MKKLLFLIIFLSWTINAFATDYTQDSNCVAAWLFSEGFGTTVDDASPHSNIGTFNSSGHPAWSSTVPNAHVNFSGSFAVASTDAIVAGNDSSTQLAKNLTLVAWIKPVTGSDLEGVISHGANGYLMRLNSSHVDFLKSQIALLGSGSTSISSGTWQHIAVTMDNSSPANITFYLNGVADGTTTSNTTFDTWANNLAIGEDTHGLNTFNGLITESAIFSRALSGVEIADIYNNGLTGSGISSTSGNIKMTGGTLRVTGGNLKIF